MNQKKRINKISDSKIFWIIISLLISIAMWSYITDREAQTITRTFAGIQVEFAGEEELLTQRNLSITDIETQSVTVTLRGSRSNIVGLRANEIKAVINVKDIKQPNAMSWAYDLEYPSNIDTSDITVLSRTPETINFSAVQNASKTINIKGSFEGEIAEGCVAEELVFQPETITVEGPEAILETIDYAMVSFGEGKIESTYTEETGFILKDKDGKTVPNAGLRFSSKTVTAIQPILKTKELPLTVNLIPGGGVKAEECTVTVEPKTIKIAADSRLIDDKDNFVLGSVDLSSFQGSYENTFIIALPDEIQNLTGVTEAKVKIQIPETHTKTFMTNNISVKNVSRGYAANIDTKEIEITLRAKSADVLNKIKPDDITVVADLTDYGTTTGQVIVNGSVYVSRFDDVGAIGEVRVTLTLSRD